MDHFLLFSIDSRRYAVPLAAVRRVERMVAAAPLPDAPEPIAGIVDFHGRMLPLFDLRRRFHLPLRPPLPGDQLLIASALGRTVALAIDAALEVRELPPCAPSTFPSQILCPLPGAEGEALLLLDLERLLSETGPAAVEVDDGGHS